MRSLKKSGGTKCMGSLSQFPTALRWTWETVGTWGWYRVCQGRSERQLPGGASFHHHKQPLSRLSINEWSLMESEGAPAVPPGLCGESKLRNAKPCLWSCPFLGDTLLPLVPDLAFLGGKVPVPEKLHRCRMQKTSPCVSLVDDSGIAIMESGTHPSGGCACSRRENSWAFISLKAKLERNVGVWGHFPSKLLMASVFKSWCSHIHPTMPKGWARFQDRISKRFLPWNHWKQTRDALCSVNTQEVKCKLSGPLMY